LPSNCVDSILITNLYGILTPSTQNVQVVSRCGTSLASVGSWNKETSTFKVLLLSEIAQEANCEFDLYLTKKDPEAFEGARMAAPPLVAEQV